MKVSKEIILDLLPLYLAGEASPATRVLVEEYLAQDPDLAQRVRRPPVDDFSHVEPLSVPPELELRTLRRTQRRIALLRWAYGWGLAFSLCALAMQISFRPFRLHPLIFEYPAELGSSLGVGLLCWVLYFLLRSKIRAA
jgi:predicted anti-sigma-YlaC factor YlaD